jgi:uncharacterized membrane protein YfcA
LILVVAAVAVAGAAQTVSGVGFALIAGPLLILALGLPDGVRLTVAMSLLLNAAVLAGMLRAVRWGDALRLLIPAVAVIPPATLLRARLNSTALSVAAGAAILVSVGLIASGRRARWAGGPAGIVAAGAASGLLNVVVGASGPPIALLVAHRDWAPRESTATVQAYSLPLNLVTLVALGVPAVRPSVLLWSGAGLLAGVGLAWQFVDRVSARTVRMILLLLAAVGGAGLVLRAVLGH